MRLTDLYVTTKAQAVAKKTLAKAAALEASTNGKPYSRNNKFKPLPSRFSFQTRKAYARFHALVCFNRTITEITKLQFPFKWENFRKVLKGFNFPDYAINYCRSVFDSAQVKN